MRSPRYTSDDMRVLASVSRTGSVPSSFLPVLGYSPKRFKEFLKERGLSKDVYYLFDAPLDRIPTVIDDASLQGYVNFRLSVGK